MVKILIVLGGGLNERKELNEASKLRYEKAIEIEKEYDFIICSSKKTYRKKAENQSISEAEAGKRFLLKKGVTENKIILEDKSQDTFSNAYFCREIIDSMKVKKFTVITSKFHMEKSMYLFDIVFGGLDYKYDFVECENPKDDFAVKMREIHEKEMIKFYKDVLFDVYGIIRGDMKTIGEFMEKNNPALTGVQDNWHRELTEKIKKLELDVEKYY